MYIFTYKVMVNQWRIHDFPKEGAPTYDFVKISQKLYEIGPGGRPSCPPYRVPLRYATVKRSFLAVLFVLFHFVQKSRNLVKKLFLFPKVHVKDHVRIHVESSWLTIKVKSYAFLFKFMNRQYLLFSKKISCSQR